MANTEPTVMPHELLRQITDGFSDERILGYGTCGVVYKGEDKDGQEIAVKMLHYMDLDDKAFYIELGTLTKLKHPNIVQLVGFCNETKEVPIEYNGKQITAVRMYRALCFEYMPNGSLEKHLYDEHHGFGWWMRYKIIKGICEGLKYLHLGLERPVYHLDLKPGNILLDNNMEPKIADFGLSRLLGEENTKRTLNPLGTLGYCPPEFIEFQIISKEYDIFSLGVIIIKIICGRARYFHVCDMEPYTFVADVQNQWRERLQATLECTSIEIECQQVKKCMEIAMKCIAEERIRRPTIGCIVSQLRETERQ